jgi:hypothetical protein
MLIFDDLPEKIQRQVITFLENDNFIAAKQVVDKFEKDTDSSLCSKLPIAG